MSNRQHKPVRVLVVDDSPFMRKAITLLLESDPNIKVVGTAVDGEEGVRKTLELQPDIITLDIQMPRMDGLTALREIMLHRPTPIIMLSSITREGTSATLQALELGALDFILKHDSYEGLEIARVREELLYKIRNLASSTQEVPTAPSGTVPPGLPEIPSSPIAYPGSSAGMERGRKARIMGKADHPVDVIVVGSSTGGPPALKKLISSLPRNLPVGIVVAQHMPPAFTRSLAERLDGQSDLQVREAKDGDTVDPGTVLFGPGGLHITLRRRGSRPIVRLSVEPRKALYRPCVDVLMDSAARAFGRRTLGIMMSGMGSNGAEGARAIKTVGGLLIAQNERSCVVYGMPKAVVEAGLADHILPIEEIADTILSYL